MTTLSKQLLFWAPRLLCLLFIGFVSMFALDVFNETRGFWKTVVALAMHLRFSFVMLVGLVVAWRWEWVGAVLYLAAGIFFGVIVRAGWAGKAMFVVPCVLTAGLFLWNWVSRAELRAVRIG